MVIICKIIIWKQVFFRLKLSYGTNECELMYDGEIDRFNHVPCVFISTWYEFWQVVLPSGEEVEKVEPNFDEIQKCPGRGIIITGIAPTGSGFDFYSRFFCPKLGIDEVMCRNLSKIVLTICIHLSSSTILEDTEVRNVSLLHHLDFSKLLWNSM